MTTTRFRERLPAVFAGGSLGAAKAFAQAAGLLMMLAAAKVLTPTEFGIFALASALTMILNQLVGVGPYEYVIRERNSRTAEHTAFWINMGVAGAASVVGIAIAAFAGSIYKSAALQGMIAILAALTFPAGWRSVIESVMVRDGKLGRLGAASMLVETLGLIGGLAALAAGWGVFALVVQKVVQFLSGVPVYSLFARWLPKRQFNREEARGMTSFGAGILGDRVLGYLQAYGVDLLLGLLSAPAAVALYRMGARVVVAVVAVLSDPLRVICWSRLSREREEGRDLRQGAEATIGGALVLITGPMVGLGLVADLLIEILLGPRWAGAGEVALFLALAAAASVPAIFSDAIFGVAGRTGALTTLRACTLAVMLLALAVSAPHGAVWTAAGQLVAAVAGLAVVMAFQHRVTGVDPRGYLRAGLCSLAAALVMTLAVMGVRHFLPAGAPLLLELALSILCGGAAYVLAVRVAYGSALPDVALSAVRK